jgi:hypothetical protein
MDGKASVLVVRYIDAQLLSPTYALVRKLESSPIATVKNYAWSRRKRNLLALPSTNT